MNIINENSKEQQEEILKEWENTSRRGRLFGGLMIVAIGALFLLRELDFWLPEWIFSWQMLLIAIGTFIGLKHSFKNIGWIVLILIGGAFLLKDFFPQLHISNIIWPVAIILGGIYIIFKPRRRECKGKMEWQYHKARHTWHHGKEYNAQDQVSQTSNENTGTATAEDFIDYNAIFGGIKKNIISKTFRGGEINAVFGGAEVNLMQADFTGTIELEINSVFGGTRLIIPSNWTVKSEVAAVMGSVEDKRLLIKDVHADPNKILILRGNAVFGGIDIQSYS